MRDRSPTSLCQYLRSSFSDPKCTKMHDFVLIFFNSGDAYRMYIRGANIDMHQRSKLLRSQESSPSKVVVLRYRTIIAYTAKRLLYLGRSENRRPPQTTADHRRPPQTTPRPPHDGPQTTADHLRTGWEAVKNESKSLCVINFGGK